MPRILYNLKTLNERRGKNDITFIFKIINNQIFQNQYQSPYITKLSIFLLGNVEYEGVLIKMDLTYVQHI